jgi:sulfate adenylyltransferase
VTAEAPAGVMPDITGLPTWTLTEEQLGDLELLLTGAFAPLRGFMSTAEAERVATSGTLGDGTPWPVPVVLDVPAGAVPATASRVALLDPEGVPLAILDVTGRWPATPAPGGPPLLTLAGRADGHGGAAALAPAPGGAAALAPAPGGAAALAPAPGGAAALAPAPGGAAALAPAPGGAAGLAPAAGPGRHARPADPDPTGLVRLSGPVSPCREPEHGPFRGLRRTPAEVRAELAGQPALAFATRRPLHSRQIGQLRYLADQLRARLLLLPLTAGPAEVVLRPEALVRAVRAAARHLPPGTLVVPVPLASRSAAPDRELAIRAQVASAYGATHLLADEPRTPVAADGAIPAPIQVLTAGEWAYDRTAEVWRPLALIEPGAECADLAGGELEDVLERGGEIPDWFTPPAVAAELRRARPPRSERGLVVFLTGLSGSGKSTIARALRDSLLERGDRSVSLLDGDLVRQLLSAGLTFSRADRDLNIARIGFVAAEVARHGGIAICAPIAPYAAARAQVRSMVMEAGDFLLVHVATPVEVCEARDRKGLYAKARAGLIDHFTGVSDPYEEPKDADLVLDTSTMTRQEALDAVLRLLTDGGWLPPGGS